jgi:hypothetical protein
MPYEAAIQRRLQHKQQRQQRRPGDSNTGMAITPEGSPVDTGVPTTPQQSNPALQGVSDFFGRYKDPNSEYYGQIWGQNNPSLQHLRSLGVAAKSPGGLGNMGQSGGLSSLNKLGNLSRFRPRYGLYGR